MRFTDLFAHDTDTQVVHLAGDGTVTTIMLPHELTDGGLVFIKNAKFLKTLTERAATTAIPGAAAIFDLKLWNGLTPDAQAEWKQKLTAIGVSPNVPLSMARLSLPLYQRKFGRWQGIVDGRQLGTTEIHPSAQIAQGAFIGEHVSIGANVVIHAGSVVSSHVSIGADSVLFPHVVLYPFTQIGQGVRIHANSTIGADGFGYVFDKGVHHKIWHTGGVIVHDQVEIGANSSVDMGTFTPTVIGRGTRIDNQVQIGHNTKIGTGCVLCGQAGIAGSAVLEDFVVLGGRAAIGPDAHIGKGCQIAGGAMVNESAVWPAGSVLGGHPARDIKEWMRTFAWVRKNALKS